MTKHGIGIYIGKNFIDVVTISGSIKKPLLIDHVTKEIRIQDTGIQAEGPLRNSIIDALKFAFSKITVRPDEIFLVLPQAAIMVRHFNMPPLFRAEQEQAIKFEAKKYIPFKIDEVISDFKIINISKETKTMSVFFVAAKKKDVELQLKYSQDAAVGKIAGIDIAPLALLKVLKLNNQFKKDEAMALVQLNKIEDIAAIDIVEGDYPAVTRDIMIAQYKETLTEKLISELRVSLDYYKRKPGSKFIKKIILCGKDDLSDLVNRIQSELNIATEIIDFSKLIGGFKFESLGGILAYGAAMNSLSTDAQVINLLPTAARTKKIASRRQYPIAIRIAVLLILSLILYGLIITGQAKTHYLSALGVSRNLPPATEGVSIEELQALKDKNINQIAFTKSLLKERTSVTEKLNRIAANLPEGVWINSLHIETLPNLKVSLSLQGGIFLKDSAEQMNTADKFLNNLKNDPVFMNGFESCELGIIRKEAVMGSEITSYSIQCRDKK